MISQRGTVSRFPIRAWWAVVLLGCAIPLTFDPASAQDRPSGAAPGDTLPEATLIGRVVDADREAPVAGATLRVPELGRGTTSDAAGEFRLRQLPPGTYVLSLRRIGYAPVEREVELSAGDTLRLTVPMRASALELSGVVVTTGGRDQRAEEVFQPTSVLSGAELRRRVETSVAATLASEPGIAQRYNGPAASQPVIRGLSGDRVLVLEDGNRTGDVSSTAADHAVTSDPVGAERIEVVRGPAGLLYGSNALGGVINVIRGDVPRVRPERLTGSASLQGESVNEGGSAAAELSGGVGQLAWRAAASGRVAGNTHTPLGVLPSTDLGGHSATAGLSWIRPEGFIGFAVRDFSLDYGVPGTFEGQTIPGAHEGGVDIEMRRVTGTGTAARLAATGPFSSLEVDGTYTWYRHREIEPSGFIGTEFGQLSGTVRLIARHRHADGSVPREGAVGFWGAGKDFSVAGSNTGTRPAREYTLAGFGYEDLGWGPFRLQLGGRYDWTRIEPLDTRPGPGGEVRTRDFGAVSASVSGLVELATGLTTGVSVARAFRTPAIEELFSDGPHLADYSYNIGNPTLDPEFGLGVDVFARLNRPRFRAEAAVFRNRIDGFIYYLPTGQLDPRLGRFPVYQAAQTDALLVGGEGMLEWEALLSLVLRAQGSYVRGTRMEDDEPLPAIPPLQGLMGARYERPRWFASVEWRVAAEQSRVTENESPTDGYSLLDVGAGLRWTAWGQSHSLTLGVGNLMDQTWRDHLSRVRTVAPQPGRNVRLLYHVQF
ncbi:MAG: TonB-dependent receptor [Gemmatimonas sp.]|nr:TonB-dependent receptor [Gemmatimonas sp.]